MIYIPAEKLASLGVPFFVANNIITSLLLLALCLVFSLITSPVLRKSFQFFFSLSLSFYMWGFAYTYQLFVVLIVYIILAICPSRKLAYYFGHLTAACFLVYGHWI